MDPKSNTDHQAKGAGTWVLAAAILGSGISFIDGTVVNVVLPVLQRELNASVSQVQWIVESYALILSSLMLVGGSLGDRLGRNKIFSIGIFVFAAGSVWCGLSPDIRHLIAARALQGIGGALLVPGSLALISANFSRKTRGKAIGTWSGVTAIAAGIGPVLGGWLVDNASWRWIFFINVPPAIAAILIAYFKVPESRDEKTAGRIDWTGAVLATIGLGGIVFGLIESNGHLVSRGYIIAAFIIGAAALIAFLFVESRIANPMMPLELFRSSSFAGANLLTLLLYAALGAVMFFLPFNLIQVQGYSPMAAGGALVPFVITMFLASRWAGGLVDKYGGKLPLIVGPLVTACGFALFAVPGTNAGSYWLSFFPAVMVMSIGMSISVAPLTTTVMGSVEDRHAGIASGINNAVSRAASLLAVAVFGVITLYAFRESIAQQLSALNVSAEIKDAIMSQTGDLFNMKIPAGLDGSTAAGIRAAIGSSFVYGFRITVLVSAAMAVLSAAASWWMIDGKLKAGGKERGEDQ
jgi:EmrB/QacA subfamily drug resistance transporter